MDSLGPQIVALSGPSAGEVFPVEESGLRLSDEFIAYQHEGRAVAYACRDGAEIPWYLLDHDAQIVTGGCEFRFEHFEIAPDHVFGMFPEVRQSDPMQSHDVQKYFIDLVRTRIPHRVAAGVFLNAESGRGNYSHSPLLAFTENAEAAKTTFLPGFYNESEGVYCAKLSDDNSYLGVLYVYSWQSVPFSKQERAEIVRVAAYLSIFVRKFAPFDRDKRHRLIAISGPNAGQVIPLSAAPTEVGPMGVEDTEPTHQIRVMPSGEIQLRGIRGAVERRLRHVLALVFQEIPAAMNVAVCLADPGRSGEFCSVRLPDDFDIDTELFFRSYSGELGMATNESGTICAVAIFDRSNNHFDPTKRTGVIYLESHNGCDADPDQLVTLEKIARVAAQYLSAPEISNWKSGDSPRRLH